MTKLLRTSYRCAHPTSLPRYLPVARALTAVCERHRGFPHRGSLRQVVTRVFFQRPYLSAVSPGELNPALNPDSCQTEQQRPRRQQPTSSQEQRGFVSSPTLLKPKAPFSTQDDCRQVLQQLRVAKPAAESARRVGCSRKRLLKYHLLPCRVPDPDPAGPNRNLTHSGEPPATISCVLSRNQPTSATMAYNRPYNPDELPR